MSDLILFKGDYRYIPPGMGGYEYREEFSELAMARTESEALGLFLEENPETHSPWWTVYPLETGVIGIVQPKREETK